MVGWVTLSDIARRLLLETDTACAALNELSAPGSGPSQAERRAPAECSGDWDRR